MATKKHSKNYKKVLYYYTHYDLLTGERLWGIERVRAAVGKWITADEYKEITGEELATNDTAE